MGPTTPTADRHAWKPPRWAPGLAVMLAVLLLLRGVTGTAEALRLQLTTFMVSFVGGPDTIALVVWHTLPLGIAAAAITYAVAADWLKFESFGAVVVASLVVLGAAWLGGELRDAALPSGKINGPVAIATADGMDRGEGLPRTTMPANRLRGVDWLAEPDFTHNPVAIAPVALLPEAHGAWGFACRAGNQLLGYLVAYNPRLFVASLLAGGYLGWSWQRRIARWTAPPAEPATPGDQALRRAA